MKQIKSYITESAGHFLVSKKGVREYAPASHDELIDIVERLIKEEGHECDLNCIDVSEITDMSNLFSRTKTLEFRGDISEWDVSACRNMDSMFYGSKFNGDISGWNVSNVRNMDWMFARGAFNSDISKWNVSKVKSMSYMFAHSKFNQDISEWDVPSASYGMFEKCPLKDHPEKQPKFAK